MNILVCLILSLFLTASTVAWADDLGMAGALSGFGQGMGRGFESMQSGIIQQGLMDQRAAHERQLQADRHQREMEQIRSEHAREMVLMKQRADEQRQMLEERKSLARRKALLLAWHEADTHDTLHMDLWDLKVNEYNEDLDSFNDRWNAYTQRWGLDRDGYLIHRR